MRTALILFLFDWKLLLCMHFYFGNVCELLLDLFMAVPRYRSDAAKLSALISAFEAGQDFLAARNPERDGFSESLRCDQRQGSRLVCAQPFVLRTLVGTHTLTDTHNHPLLCTSTE